MRALIPAVVVTAILGAAVGQAGCNRQPTFVTQDKFAQTYAQALCTSLKPCCDQNAVSSDFAACTKGWEAVVNNLLYGPQSTGNYNITLATNCINLVRAANGQSCQPGPSTLSDARATCQAIFQGQVPLGSPCTSAQQCAQVDGSVITCATVPGDGGGGGGGGQLPLAANVSLDDVPLRPEDVPVCVLLPPDDAGAAGTPPPCQIFADAGTDTCISQGMFCDPVMKACTPFSAAMGPCDPAAIASCQPGNYCQSGGAMPGTCAAGGAPGSPCTDPAMCDSTGYCDTAGSHTCQAILQPGQACTSGTQCSIGLCNPTTKTCLANAIATTAACNGTF